MEREEVRGLSPGELLHLEVVWQGVKCPKREGNRVVKIKTSQTVLNTPDQVK